MIETQKPLSELRKCISLFPQAQSSVVVKNKIPFNKLPGLQSALESIEKSLGTKGRLLIRYSGTEPKLRLLIEAETSQLVEHTMQELKKSVAQHLSHD